MDPLDILLQAITARLTERSNTVRTVASGYATPSTSPTSFTPDDLKKLSKELRDVVKEFDDLAKAGRVLTQEQKTQQKQGQQQAEAQKKQREREERITMGRLPIASIPAMLHGNTSAGARVGYALGEQTGIGRWAGLGVGAGVAGGIGAAFAASPMGTDIIFQPLKLLAGTIGADVLPALHKFGSTLLDIADWWKEHRSTLSVGTSVLATAAVGLGAGALMKGAGNFLGFGGGAAGGAAAAGGMMGFMGKVGGASNFIKGAGSTLGLGSLLMQAPDMIAGLGGGGSNEGRSVGNSTMRYVVSGLAGILGTMLGGPAGGMAAGAGMWSLTSGGRPEGAQKPSANDMILYQEQLQRIGGRAKMGTDFTEIQKSAQMASFESPLEMRQRQVFMEGIDKVVKAITGK